MSLAGPRPSSTRCSGSKCSDQTNVRFSVAQGLVMCSKVKTRNLLSDFKSAFKSIKGGELTELSKLTQDVRYLRLKWSKLVENAYVIDHDTES